MILGKGFLKLVDMTYTNDLLASICGFEILQAAILTAFAVMSFIFMRGH